MTRHSENDGGSWELVQRGPHPLLRPYVRSGYEGYRQAMRAPVRRLEVPHGGIVLIIGLGPKIDVDGAAHTSFVAGLYGAPVVVSDDGRQVGNAKAAGAQITIELRDTDYGSRDYAATDPEGNSWSFGTTGR